VALRPQESAPSAAAANAAMRMIDALLIGCPPRSGSATAPHPAIPPSLLLADDGAATHDRPEV
jgi:hypothetical protein